MARKKVKSDKGRKKVARVLQEFSQGKLKSSSGEKVTDPAQAKAIALSEARGVEKKKKKKKGKK